MPANEKELQRDVRTCNAFLNLCICLELFASDVQAVQAVQSVGEPAVVTSAPAPLRNKALKFV
jgi:hypothetical protein